MLYFLWDMHLRRGNAKCLLLLLLLAVFVKHGQASWQNTVPAVGAPAQASLADQPLLPARLSGSVRDGSGDIVQGLAITLAATNSDLHRATTTGNEGKFSFEELPPGIYLLTIEAHPGSNGVASAEIELNAGEHRDFPIVGGRFPTVHTSVEVTATLNEVAQSQVEQQEKQRVAGIFPNFYSSYVWDAVPLTPKLKYKLTLRSTLDPVTFLVVGVLAGVEQKHKTFPGYGQGAEGYAKRYGAAYADTAIAKLMSRAVMPSLLHQDPRYFYRGSGTIRSRIFYALSAAVMCRGDNGRWEPNYSQIAGNFAAAGISNLYRSPSDRTAGLTFRNGFIMMASGAAENLMREFLLKRLTTNVPSFAKGKP